MRAAIYARLSRDTEASTSIDRQVADCRRLIEARGWTEAGVWTDVDVSGWKVAPSDRPGLRDLRSTWGEIDALVFWKLDRLGRNLLDFSALLADAKDANVALVSVTEGFDVTTPMGKAMASIVAIFAEMEAEAISARRASSAKHLATEGRWATGRAPYGWRIAPRDAGAGYRLTLDPDTAPVLREVVAKVTAGESYSAVARWLNAHGHRPPLADAWGPTSVVSMLKDRPGLMGLAQHRGRLVKDAEGRPLVAHEPLLTRSEYEALQAAVDGRSGPQAPRHETPQLLTGLARCAICHRPLFQRHARRRGRVEVSYVCHQRQAPTCPGVSIRVPTLDGAVLDEVKRAVGHLPVVETITTASDATAEDVAELEAALADLAADRYERGLFRGEDGAERFATLYGALEDRLAAVREAARPASTETVETGETFSEALDRADVVEANAVLGSVLEGVYVARKGSEAPRWKISWMA